MNSLFICDDPAGPWWQLGHLPPAHGRMLMLGWSRPEGMVDSGIPDDLAVTIASAICSVAKATFPVADAVARRLADIGGEGSNAVSRVSAAPLQAARAIFSGRPASVMLLTTRAPTLATLLFSDPDFPWHLQGQAAILSMPHQHVPAVDYTTLSALVDGHWEDRAEGLHSAGIAGLIRPGVDGDVLGIYTFTQQFHEQITSALERTTQSAGLAWARLSERDFSDLIAR